MIGGFYLILGNVMIHLNKEEVIKWKEKLSNK